MIAQAMVEKGLLDGAIAGVSSAVSAVGDAVEAKPYVLIILGVVLFFLLRKRR